jgi:hypothetical protein
MVIEPPQIRPPVNRIPPEVGAYWGVVFPEQAISVRRFQIRYFPEQDIRHQNYQGETFIRTISRYFSREVVCEGEITAAAGGIMAFTLGTVCSFANTVTHFGATFGTLLLDEASITSERHGWASVSVKCSANPAL